MEHPPDPVLDALSDELRRLGYVVVPHGAGGICVRLALVSSVRIRRDAEGRFRFTPKFGPFGRTGGLLFTTGVSAAVVGGTAAALGAAPLTLLAGFLGVTALAHDACRFVLTEGCLTRLQQLITTSRALEAAEALPASSQPAQIPASHARPAIEASPRR